MWNIDLFSQQKNSYRIVLVLFFWQKQLNVFGSDIMLKEATKLYFTHYLHGAIILFNTGSDKSAFSTYSFHFLSLSVFSVFSACSVFLFHLRKLYKIYIIIVLCRLLCDFIVKTWKNSRFRIRKTYWKMSLFWTLKETLVKQTRIFFFTFSVTDSFWFNKSGGFLILFSWLSFSESISTSILLILSFKKYSTT